MDVESQSYKKNSSKYRRSVMAGIMCGTVAGGMIALCVIVMVGNVKYPVDYIPDFYQEYTVDYVNELSITEGITEGSITTDGWAIICSGDTCRTINPDENNNIIIDGNRLP